MNYLGYILNNGVISFVQRSIQLDYFITNVVDSFEQVKHILFKLFLDLLWPEWLVNVWLHITSVSLVCLGTVGSFCYVRVIRIIWSLTTLSCSITSADCLSTRPSSSVLLVFILAEHCIFSINDLEYIIIIIIIIIPSFRITWIRPSQHKHQITLLQSCILIGVGNDIIYQLWYLIIVSSRLITVQLFLTIVAWVTLLECF